jgi:trigger factor
MTELISEQLAEVIQEQGFRSVSPPKILEVEAEEGTDISVSASLEIVPGFKISDYSKVVIPIEITRVTDDDVDQAINYQREHQGTKVQVTDRSAEDHDFVKLDFKGTMNGKVFEGGEGSDHIVQIGSEYLLKDMGNQLIGMSVGEEKDIPVKIPENYSANKTIAGQDVIFHVSLKGIQKNQLPELNDDFAKNIKPKDKFTSLEDMKLKIKSELEEHARGDAHREAKKIIAKRITEMNPIEVPEGLVEEQIKHMVVQDLKKEQQSKNQTEPIDEDEIHVSDLQKKDHRENAIQLLQQELVLDQLATNLNIEIEEDELNAEVNNMVRMLGETNAQKMKKEWEKNGVLSRLQSRIKRDKTLDSVMKQVQIKEEVVDRKEHIDNN